MSVIWRNPYREVSSVYQVLFMSRQLEFNIEFYTALGHLLAGSEGLPRPQVFIDAEEGGKDPTKE